MRALNALVTALIALVPAVRTTTVNGPACDLANQQSAMVHLNVGTITDGTHTPKLQDSPDNSTWTDVDPSFITGTALVALTSSTPQKVGYIGAQRYLRLVVTVTGSPATGGAYSAVTLTKPRKLPAA